MTNAQAHAIAEATLYALRCGCFFPVPDPKPPVTTEHLIQWGAMRHLHTVIAENLRVQP
jgi:hypothetical protein